ncbi:MAG TPA: CaiB/BaiF CoA-transferase family protein [Solirubrobacteraceae bacterium]|nr:CaiB/BaiF CoA-transferase family protein [Solirubrobacteraceae bacterium]
MTLPLEGLTVLDLSRLLPGGFCSLLLSDFGADVIKVEEPGSGDYIRWAPPRYEGAQDSAASALFMALNRGKRSVGINLRCEGGRRALLALVRRADVLLESFRPGVMERLGVGWEVLSDANPRLVYCAITGYGRHGPDSRRSGHDLNYLARNGVLALAGEAGGPPVVPGVQVADLGGGALMAAVGILVALRERERSGRGQLVDCSMFDGSLSWLAMLAAEVLAGGRAPRRGEVGLAGRYCCYRPYECADGWVTLAALEPKFWRAFCEGVGREDLIGGAFEPPGSPTHSQLAQIMRSRTREQWQRFSSEHDCCLEPVLELDEALESELVAAREMVVELAQPGVASPVRLLGVPIKLSRTPGDPARGPAPALGEHTDEVLAAAGLSSAEIAALHEQRAIGGPGEWGEAAGEGSQSRPEPFVSS